MEPANAFIGQPGQSTAVQVTGALGTSAPAWSQLVSWISENLGISQQKWKSSGKNYGWSLRLRQKDRNIMYLSPCDGCFRVSLALGDKAMDDARHAHLSRAAASALSSAPHYAEGWGVRLTVKTPLDLEDVRTLAAIKLAH
jgi:hypothetical protein